MIVDLPVVMTALQETARRLRTTPFLIVFSTLLSLIARRSDETDISARVASNGRPLRYLSTMGWFADAFPFRIRDHGLADPERALLVTRRLMAQILQSPYTAPWEYIRRACPSSESGTASDEGARQLMFNSPAGPRIRSRRKTFERTVPGDVDALHLFFATNAGGLCRLTAFSGHDNFDPNGVLVFLHELVDTISHIAAPDSSPNLRSHDSPRSGEWQTQSDHGPRPGSERW